MLVTFNEIKHNRTIRTYIEQADRSLKELSFTEHSFPHVTKAAHTAAMILTELGYTSREAELAKIAGFMHDIGNVINRIDHAQSGAIMAFRILDHLGMDPEEIALVISAIGNHDEHTAAPVNPIAAALIIADKTDVRRSRVRQRSDIETDIHDRVNYAVEETKTYFNEDKTAFVLEMQIDTAICPVMDYFQIFLERMALCRRAAKFLNVAFNLIINGQQIL